MPFEKGTLLERFERRVLKTDDHWIWQGAVSKTSGYGTYRAWGVQTFAHRIAYVLYVGPIPDGLEVCHECDIKLCVRGEHLWVGTHQENIADMHRKGRAALGEALNHRSQRGELNHASKLTQQVVDEIRFRVDSGERQAQVARDLGVSTSNVWNIIHRNSWT